MDTMIRLQRSSNGLFCATICVAVALVLAGCQHTPPPHRNPKKILNVPGKQNVVKEVHHTRKPAGGHPNQTDGVYIALAPRGTVIRDGKTDDLKVVSRTERIR